jgi:NAD(P)-dependent dehydrogenase (short-subunit alcohol dehydrogenase family)
MRFVNKKVLITGASRGIGREIARLFHSEGAWVIGTRTGKKINDEGYCHEWIEADFTNLKDLYRCSKYIRESSLDILINNAGINKNAPFSEIVPDDFLHIQQVNVFAPFLLCQAALPAMKKNGWGRIVNVSSIWGKISMPQRASYSASKYALDGLTVALAAEYASSGIIANCVAPGFVDTELTSRMLGKDGIKALLSKVPASRLGSVNEIASFILWLSSPENTFVVGQNIAIDGGFTRV